MTVAVETKKYVGIADAHGIESFFSYGTSGTEFLGVRAMTNRHRHAVYFEVDLTDGQIDVIVNKLKGKGKNRFKDALKLLKHFVMVDDAPCSLGGGGNVQQSFILIPDPKLDSWDYFIEKGN